MQEYKGFFRVKALTNILDCSERAIQLMVERGNITEDFYRYVPGKGRGGKQLEINPLGLPEPYRTQWITHQEDRQIERYRSDSDLPKWALDYAKARLDVVRLLERELRRAKQEGRPVTPVYDETADMYNSGHLLEDAFVLLGKVSGQTVRRWRKDYKDARKKGKPVIEALAPNWTTNKGRRTVPKWYREKLLAILLHPNEITVARGIKIVNMNLRREGKEPPCSERTASRWVEDYRKAHKDRWVLMREGRKALNDQVNPYLDRDWNLLEVGEVLIADGHVLNFDVKHPVTGKAHRPTLICFYDGRSRYPVGVSIMPTENIDNINEALIDAVRTLGKFPQAVILDNGRAFKAKHFTASPSFDDAGLAGTYERHGILMHTTKPYHGQSKPIEPFFNQLNERFSKLLPTYRGSSIDNKVPRLKRNEKEHRRAYQQQVGDWLPTVAEVIKAIKHWARESYGQEAHDGLRKGETPWSVLEAGRGPGVEYAQLIDLMLRAKEVTPRRCRIRLEGIVYQNWEALYGWEKPVLVRYTRNVPEKIWVFDTSGPRNEFMCIARAFEAVHPLEKLTGEDGEFDPTIRERLRQRQKLEKRARLTAEELDAMNRDLAEPVGNLLPPSEPAELPDATPNDRDKGIEIEPIEFNVEIEAEDDGEPLFEHPFERFEHIAGKDPGAITPQDVAFLKDFTETEIYNDLYAAEHQEWVQAIINE